MEETVNKGMEVNRAIRKRRAIRKCRVNAAASLNLSTADKGLEVNGATPKSRDIGRIIVTGYDTGGSRKHVKRELKKLYSSCGEITDVCIPKSHELSHESLWRSACIYFVGEGAVDKALQLNGTDMGGWTVSAENYPFDEPDNHYAVVKVKGYDNSLSKIDIRCALDQLFSSCGKIKEAWIFDSFSKVTLVGVDVAETAPKLSGSDMGGRNVVVRLLSLPAKYTVHPRQHIGCGYGRRW